MRHEGKGAGQIAKPDGSSVKTYDGPARPPHESDELMQARPILVRAKELVAEAEEDDPLEASPPALLQLQYALQEASTAATATADADHQL